MIRARTILPRKFDEKPDSLIRMEREPLKDRILHIVNERGEIPKSELHNLIGHSGHANVTLAWMVYNKRIKERGCECGRGTIVYKVSKRL